MSNQRGIIVSGTAADGGNPSPTSYAALFGTSEFTQDATEAHAQIKIRDAGTAKLLHVQVGTNLNTSASTVALMDGGVATGISVSIAASSTGTFSDTSDTFPVSAGDLLDYKITPGSAATLSFGSIGFSLELTTQCSTIVGTGRRMTINSPGSTLFSGIGAISPSWGAGDADAGGWGFRAQAIEAATLSNLQAQIATNSTSVSTTVATRKNGAAGAQSVAITSSTTGLFEDTSHTDSLTTSDVFDFSSTTAGGSGSATGIVAVKHAGAVAGQVTLYSTFPQGNNISSVQHYASPCCVFLGNTSEADARMAAPSTGAWKLLSMHVGVNNASTSMTVTSRKNGAAGAQSLTVTAATTGLFQDTSHSDSIALGDALTIGILKGNGGANHGGMLASLFVASAPAIYSQSAAGSTTPAALVSPSTVHGLTSLASTTPASSSVAVAKHVRTSIATSSSAASVQKRVSKALRAMAASIAAAAADATCLAAFGGATTPAAVISRALSCGRKLTAATTPPTSVVKSVGKMSTGSTTPPALLASLTSRPRTLSAISPASASVTRQVSKTVGAIISPVVLVQKGFAITLRAGASAIAVLATVLRTKRHRRRSVMIRSRGDF